MFLRKTISILLLAASGHCYGYDSLPSKDSSTITIKLQNAADKLSKIDSVYIIFDRYDLRGAGVIKQVYYPDPENQVQFNLPVGKYYVDIYCLGIYNKIGFNRIVTARSRKNKKIFLLLQQSAIYHRGNARMPLEHFDPSHLAIFKNGSD